MSSAGVTKRIDQCTFCSCMNSTSVCRRDTCPPLNCPIAKQFYPTNDSCCLQCPTHYENNRTVCQVGDRIFRVSATQCNAVQYTTIGTIFVWYSYDV